MHIAGIAASAGGLEAMLPMFAQLYPTGRIAYVVVQHMAHDGHSELVARLIQRESTLPVVLVTDTVELKPDRLYMVPAGKDGQVRSNMLLLFEPKAGSISTPSVNMIFYSIAENSGANAIAIVLSGAGSDGTDGCRAIKAAGGLVFVQQLTEAKHAGMPGAVIDAGLADQVLPVAAIGPRLAELFPGTVQVPNAANLTAASQQPEPDEQPGNEAAHRELELLLRQVLDATGIDFSSYKEETLLRRLEKRKLLLGITSADAYQAIIRHRSDELHRLQHMFLVSQSSFFRDRESFLVLERYVAKGITSKQDGEPIRIWVPACASGEEPYTLAIMLRELLANYHRRHPIEITASDLNPDALEMARQGVYRQTAFKEMDAALRDRWFTLKGQHYEVVPELKNYIRFEQRDILNGTVLKELDLVSCRNLLIYMKSHLQDQLITSFYQALKPQGLLFLGQYESLTFVGNSMFALLDHYHRLFCRRY
jgi:chemotaxis methyl-accepting protein methylase